MNVQIRYFLDNLYNKHWSLVANKDYLLRSYSNSSEIKTGVFDFSKEALLKEYQSYKELHGKKRDDMHEMIHQKGDNWANLRDDLKNGRLIIREEGTGEWKVLDKCPVFTQSSELVSQFL